MFNELDVRRLWSLLGFGPGRWAEMRCVDMQKGGGVLSRLFTEDVNEYVKWAREWNGRGNCFVGRNPRKAANTKEILEVSCVSLDLDPEPYDKAVGATDEQTEECVNAGRHIGDHLQSLCGARYSLCLSGNGALLVWTGVSGLAASDDTQRSIGRFQDEARELIREKFRGVKIDTTQDHGRLIKLVGTLSVKGRTRLTRFLSVAGAKGVGDNLFRRLHSCSEGAPAVRSGPVGPRKAVDTSRSARDFRLAAIRVAEGASDEEILAELAVNELGRNDREDDHRRILKKLREQQSLSRVDFAEPATKMVLHRPAEALALYDVEQKRRSQFPEGELPLGVKALDKLTWGIRRKDIYIVAADTNGGKSALVLNAASNLIHENKKVLALTTEMHVFDVYTRMQSIGTQIDARRIEHGGLSEDEQRRLADYRAHMKQMPFVVCDSFTPDLESVRKAVEHEKPDLLIFDHAQHTVSGGSRSDVEKMSEFVVGLKQLAMDTNCAVLLVSQIKRLTTALNYRTGQSMVAPISIHDLKGCSALEQEAAFILLLSPEEEDSPDNPTLKIKAELAKNRFGPKTAINLVFHKSTVTFTA